MAIIENYFDKEEISIDGIMTYKRKCYGCDKIFVTCKKFLDIYLCPTCTVVTRNQLLGEK